MEGTNKKITPDLATMAAAALLSSARGFAVLDPSLEIIEANPQMDVILGKPAVGQALDRFFPNDAQLIRKLCNSTAPRQLERMIIRSDGVHPERIVTCEFGRVELNDSSYPVVILADVTRFVSQDLAALDGARFGVVRLDDQQPPVVRYINNAGADLLGQPRDAWEGQPVDVEGLFPFPEDLDRFNAERSLRASGQASKFSISVRQARTGADIPLDVFAFPEFDIAGERVTGTIAIFQSKLNAQVGRDIQTLCEEYSNLPHKLALKCLPQIGKVVPHDFAVITLYFGEWARSIHLEPKPDPIWPSTWFRLTPMILEGMKVIPDLPGESGEPLGGALVPDMAVMFDDYEDAEDLAQDKVTKRLLDEGHKYLLSLPLRNAAGWRISLTLMRKAEGKPFEEADLVALRGEVGALGFLQSFIEGHEKRTDKMKSSLRQSIKSAGSLDSALAALPDALADHYQLQHVSYFRCNYADQKFLLRDQNGPSSNRFTLPEPFPQDFDGEGHLALCLERCATVVCNDLQDGSADANAFIYNQEKRETRSSMTFPIRAGGFLTGTRRPNARVAGVLHLQSTFKHAFPPPIEEEIRGYIDVIEDTLYDLQRDGIVETLQREIPTGMILCDDYGTIWSINEMALQMLGVRGDSDWRPDTLNQVFDRQDDIRIIRQPLNIKKEQVVLKHKSGAAVNVLIDTADLPWQSETKEATHGLRLLQLTDLNTLRWEHDIESVKAAVTGLTAEMKPHLVSAHVLIRQLRNSLSKAPEPQRTGDTINTLFETFKKFSVTTDRVISRLNTAPEGPRTDTADETTDLLDTLSDSLKRAQSRSDAKLLPGLSAPRHRINVTMSQSELRYLFDTVLEYFVARKAATSRLSTKVSHSDDCVAVHFRAQLGEQNLDKSDSLMRAYKLGLQFVTLNKDKLRKTLEAHGGTLRHAVNPRRNNRTEFVLTLPVAHDGP